MLLKIVYLLTCRVLGLVVLAFRGDRAKDAELLVLRRENAVLRRHVGRVRYGRETAVAPSTVWEILRAAGIDPAPRRSGPDGSSWPPRLPGSSRLISCTCRVPKRGIGC
jgi:hypothetical protein